MVMTDRADVDWSLGYMGCRRIPCCWVYTMQGQVTNAIDSISLLWQGAWQAACRTCMTVSAAIGVSLDLLQCQELLPLCTHCVAIKQTWGLLRW